MKRLVMLAAVVALMLALVPEKEAVAGPADPTYRGRPFPGCPEGAGRVVTLACVPGAAAGVAGVYGRGVFGLFCNGTNRATYRATTTVCTNPGDFNWAISGAASLRDGKQVRFGPSGTSRTVHYMVGNGEVRLDIH